MYCSDKNIAISSFMGYLKMRNTGIPFLQLTEADKTLAVKEEEEEKNMFYLIFQLLLLAFSNERNKVGVGVNMFYCTNIFCIFSDSETVEVF